MPSPGVGGVQTSLVSMVNALTARVRSRFQTGPSRDPARGKGAPILSPGGGGGTWSPGPGNNPDLTQFQDTFQPGSLYSPGYPMPPVDYEQLRMWNFPLGYNYIYTPRSFELISFPELRALGRQTLPRLCIETRKDQIEAMGWSVRPKNADKVKPSKDATTRAQNVEKFLAKPDGRTTFADHIRMQVEDMLVTDAPASEIRRTKAGTPLAWEYVDGSTFKVLVDNTGRRPLPPAPAYEQIIHGRPWVLTEDGRMSTETSGKQLFDAQIIYMPRNTLGYRPYGFSPVEQCIVTINTALRRELMQLAHFTEGNVPVGGIAGPDTWTADQIKAAQEWFDSMLVGNIDNKTRLFFLPPGTKYTPFKEAPYKDDFDEWLARIVSFAFSLPPTWAIRQINRATAQTSKESAAEEGLEPLLLWVKRLCDIVIQDRLGQPDLEFAWDDIRPVDPKDQADVLKELTSSGINTLNEARDVLGLDPIEGGDDAFVIAGTAGPVLVKHLEDVSQIAATPPPPPMMGGPGGRPGGAPAKRPPGSGQPGGSSGGSKNTPPKSGNSLRGQTANPKKPADTQAQRTNTPRANGSAKKASEVVELDDTPFSKAADAATTRLRATLQRFLSARAADISRRLEVELGINRSVKAAIDPTTNTTEPTKDNPAANTDNGAVDQDASDQRAAAILHQLPWGDWNEPTAEIAGELASLYAAGLLACGFSAGARSLNEARANLGLRPLALGGEEVPTVLDTMPADAAAWGRDEAQAFMRGMRERSPGMFEASLREIVREPRNISDQVRNSAAFSETRAERAIEQLSRTAERTGVRYVMRASRVTKGKRWVTMGDALVEEDCLENEAASPLPIDEPWPNGDDPHIGCRCKEIPVDLPTDLQRAGVTDGTDGTGDMVSQEFARYTEDGSGMHRCKNCTMFRPPDACSYVEGDIHPEGLCRFFDPTWRSKAYGDHIQPENAVRVSLPLADPITEADIQHRSWAIARQAMQPGWCLDYEIRTIPMDLLWATQAVVDSERVEDDAEDYANEGQDPDHLPVVLQREEPYYLLAGHHHAEGALLDGADELDVQVMLGAVRVDHD